MLPRTAVSVPPPGEVRRHPPPDPAASRGTSRLPRGEPSGGAAPASPCPGAGEDGRIRDPGAAGAAPLLGAPARRWRQGRGSREARPPHAPARIPHYLASAPVPPPPATPLPARASRTRVRVRVRVPTPPRARVAEPQAAPAPPQHLSHGGARVSGIQRSRSSPPRRAEGLSPGGAATAAAGSPILSGAGKLGDPPARNPVD